MERLGKALNSGIDSLRRLPHELAGDMSVYFGCRG